MAKGRAKDKGLNFNLTKDYLYALWQQQDGKCCLTGRAFELEAGGGKVNPNTVSIDRIVPELGYVKGNVRLVIYHINVALSEYGDAALLELAKDLLGVKFA